MKRTTTGVVAAAALHWKAPERPPKSLALPEDEPFTTIAEVVKVEPVAPEGWAEVTIDGRSYWLSELSGPSFEPRVIEHGGNAFDDHCQYALGPASGQIEMELWAPGDEVRHLLALYAEPRIFTFHVRIPHQIQIEFNGTMKAVENPYLLDNIPRVRATIKLVGAPMFREGEAVNFDGEVDVLTRGEDV